MVHCVYLRSLTLFTSSNQQHQTTEGKASSPTRKLTQCIHPFFIYHVTHKGRGVHLLCLLALRLRILISIYKIKYAK